MISTLLTIPTQTSMSTREIGKLTGKQHKNVLRDAETMLEQVKEDRLKFERIYLDSMNREQKEYWLPKNLTLNLISGYRADIRLNVIDRWLELEGDISKLSPAEQILRQAQQLVEQERKLNELEHQQVETKAQVIALVQGEGFYTVVGFANLIGKRLDTPTTSKIGKKATAICRENNWAIGHAPHPTFGQVNSYPKEALELAFRDYFSGGAADED